MNEQDKQRLIIELSQRLPYNVIVRTSVSPKPLTSDILSAIISGKNNFTILPYLRPISSITTDEFEELNKLVGHNLEIDNGEIGSRSKGFSDGYEYIGIDDMHVIIDWLNKHHFDYSNLINKGLAIAAPKDMYKF